MKTGETNQEILALSWNRITVYAFCIFALFGGSTHFGIVVAEGNAFVYLRFHCIFWELATAMGSWCPWRWLACMFMHQFGDINFILWYCI